MSEAKPTAQVNQGAGAAPKRVMRIDPPELDESDESDNEVKTQPERPAAKRAKRIDPAPRHIEGVRMGDLLNADPEYHYVLVEKTLKHQGIPYYEALGYEIVRKSESEVRILGHREHGDMDTVEYLGSVLMRIHKDELQKIRQHGINGTGGQDWADQMERRIRKNKGVRSEALANIDRANHYFDVRPVTDEDRRERDL